MGILQGNSWSDKMAPKYLGNDTGLLAIPTVPVRPYKVTNILTKTAFPKDLRSIKSRGIVLHFFANHEILALELMALMLLKFPDASESFQLGMAGVMGDELAP